MRRFIIILLGCVVCWLAPPKCHGQGVITYSCWFDEDYSTLQNGTLNGNEITLDVSTLAEGFHSVNVQFGTDSTAQLQRHIFYCVPTAVNTTHATTYACWFDEDYGTLQTGQIGNGIFMLNVDSLSDGFHSVNVQYGTGRHAQLGRHFFFKVPTADQTVTDTTYACWFDEDYSTLQTGQIGNGIFMLNVDSLSEGFHSVNVQYGTGVHAQLGRYLFYKVPTHTVPSGPITYSCWFDQADSVKQSGTLPTDGIIILDVSMLSDSNHTLFVQFGSGDNAQLSCHLFWKQAIHHLDFADNPYGTITIPNASDTVIDGHFVFDSTIITITATPLPYYTLQYLIVNGDTVSWPYTMMVTADVQVSAVFAAFQPELHVVELNSSDIVAGQSFNASWTVKNDGNAATPVGAVWYDRLYLSSIPYINGNSMDVELLGTWENMSALDTGQSYTRTVTVDIPLRHATGEYYLFLLSDAQQATDIQVSDSGFSTAVDYSSHNSLVELSELAYYNGGWSSTYRHDNLRMNEVLLTVPPLADLEVTNIVRPSNFYSGSDVDVTATIVNNGQAATRSDGWWDVLYISQNDTLDASALQLSAMWHDASGMHLMAPEASYQVTFSGSVPLSMYGTAYFYVVTNADNGEYEHIGSNNNVMRSQPVNIILTPPADLVVSSVNAPSRATNKNSFSISYTVNNVGLGAPDFNNWVDKVYLSSSPQLSGAVWSQLLETVSHSGGLEAGQSYTLRRSYQLPSTIQESQTLYVVVVTDAGENVFEYLSENNNNGSSEAMSVTIFKPDFCLADATLPDTIVSGHSVDLSFKLRNIGQHNYQGGLQYNVYYSNSPTFSYSTSTLLASLSQGSSIEAESERQLTFAVAFSSGIADGNYHVFVVVNPNGSVSEENLQNNTIYAGQHYICHRPLPDLVLLNVSLPDTLRAGQETLLEFDIVNAGETTSLGAANLYSTRFHTALYVGDMWSPVVEQTTPLSMGTLTLATGDTVHFRQTVMIPPSLNGETSSISLHIDADNCLQELDETNNHASFTRHIEVLPVDLAIRNISASSEYTTGDTLRLEWSVSVEGRYDIFRHAYLSVTDTTGFSGRVSWQRQDPNNVAWYDRIYLSTDSSRSSNDIALGSASVRLRHVTDSGYTVALSAVMPHNMSGDLYLIAVADTGMNIIEHNRSNNIMYYPVTAILAPQPNLQITEMNVDDTVTQRQGCLVRYTVTNNGDAAISNALWSDAFFFGGTRIATVSHQGSLAVGESYTDSIEFVVPENMLGAYAFRAYTDINNDIYEDAYENDNTVAQPIVVQAATPCDLVVSVVGNSQQSVVGGEITVNWTVQNIGEYAVSGRIKDGIYLSLDTVFDNSDVMIGECSYQADLNVFSSIQKSLECTVNGVVPGDYYVIVRTNIMNAFNEISFSNNQRVSPTTVEVTLPVLVIGQPEHLMLPSGDVAYYRMEVGPEHVGKTLSVTLTSDSVLMAGLMRYTLVSVVFTIQSINSPSMEGTYMNSIYLSHETMPTPARFDYGTSLPYTKELRVMIPALEQGNYYFMVGGTTTRNYRQQMTLLAEIVDFGILTVDANSGSNTGSVTTKIVGAKFDTIMDFRLTKDGDYLPAEKVKFTNTNEVYATFNLVDMPVGVYTMQAELPGGIITQKEGAFTVEQGLPSELQINIVAPSDVRVGNTAVFSIEYGNNGTTDLNISGFLVTSPNHYPMALSATELDNASDSVVFYTGEFGMDPDIIRPGYFATKNIYVRANTAGTILIYVYAIRKRYE